MSAIDEAAEALGIDLLPWQREIGQRILDGELVLMPVGRRAGRATHTSTASHGWQHKPTDGES